MDHVGEYELEVRVRGWPVQGRLVAHDLVFVSVSRRTSGVSLTGSGS
jgi:hypothetical protein